MSDAQDLDAMVDELLSSRFTIHPSRGKLLVFAAKVALVEAIGMRGLGACGDWHVIDERIAELRQLVDMKARGDE